MSVYIDTHCHLDLFKDIHQDKQFEDSQGIKTITVTNAPSFYKPNYQLFDGSTSIRVALGLHPQLADQYKGEIALFEQLINNTRYIGEIGLDGSSELQGTYAIQKKLFEQMLEIIKSQDSKILTIHSRNAANETIETLGRSLGKATSKVILHWYSGSISDLKTAILKGYYFSVNHRMASSDKGKEIIQTIPEDRLLTETDAPFTFSAQVKTRLQSLNHTLNGMAFLKKKTVEEVKQIIYGNFKNLLS